MTTPPTPGGSYEPDILDHPGGNQADVEVGGADGEEAQPGEEHVMLVQPACALPHRVTSAGAGAAREAVELPADQMAGGVAGEAVEREGRRVGEDHERPDADPERAREAGRAPHVVPEEHEVHRRDVEEIAVEVLEDQREGGLAAVARAAQLADGAGGRGGEGRER